MRDLDAIRIRYVADDTWVAHVQSTAQFISGWADIEAFRTTTELRVHFAVADYQKFAKCFGEPPVNLKVVTDVQVD